MTTLIGQPMYENGVLSRVTGGVLRPGGHGLTEQMVKACELSPDACVLDVGCGTGATVEYLQAAGFNAMGVDRSAPLLQTAARQCPGLPVTCAQGQSLPLANDTLDAVLAECSLSAMADMDSALGEFQRVLRPGGRLAVSDIYVRNPEGQAALQSLPLSCGLRAAMTETQISGCLRAHGFRLLVWEDRSDVLKYLLGQMILSFGSTGEFWSRAEPEVDPFELQTVLRRAKLGYYILTAEKG